MNEIDEFDDLEIETIAAAQLFEDGECGDEHFIDEYGDYAATAHHHHHTATGSGCLTIVSVGILLAIGAALLVLAF